MNAGTANVQINRILQKTKEETPQGKKYTIHEWQCEGFLNGEPSTFTVKTLSNKVAKVIENGTFTQFEAEIDQFQNSVSYKVPRIYYDNKTPGYRGLPGDQPTQQGSYQQPPQQQPYRPAAQAPQQSSPPAAPPAVGLDDLKALYSDIFNWAKQNVSPAEEVAHAASATIFIECNKRNITLPKAPVDWSKKEEAPKQLGIADVKMILHGKGLSERCDAGQVPDEVIMEWWDASNGDDNAFAMMVNAQLTEKGL